MNEQVARTEDGTMEQNQPTIGTIFQQTYESAWGGPCAVCGRSNARHYVKVDGKRKLETCLNHARQSGLERSDAICEITSIGGNGATQLQYQTIRQFNFRDPLPGTSGRTVDSGGMTIDYFREQVANGRIVVLFVPVTGPLTPERLADRFLTLLRAEIGPQNYAIACDRNRTERNPSVCHSHDFCDANMIMLRAIGGKVPDVGNEDDPQTALWNHAWSIASVRMADTVTTYADRAYATDRDRRKADRDEQNARNVRRY